MDKVQPRRVRVEWTGPFTVAALKERGWTDENEYGLYQVYGHHVVFGSGALLYVGMARDQSFATRFSQHAGWLANEQDVLIRLGVIAPEDYLQEPPKWIDWSRLLGEVEALTIHFHSPPYNSKNIGSYGGSPLLVQNWGARGSLLPEYSSFWPPLKRPNDREET